MDNRTKRIEIFDSTLRDGSQGEGISFSVKDKLNIVKALDEFGISYIEAGNPGSNPKDLSFFEALKNIKLKNSKICAFGSTVRPGIDVSIDNNVINLLKADTEVVSIFGKTWDMHVEKVLKITLEQNLQLVEDTISYLKSKGKEVIFDAEHFFDGFKANKNYALKVIAAAIVGGADTICLCDTNGGTLPQEIEKITKFIVERFPDKKIGIHCHNDIGCGVANSVSAVLGGAVQVQGTFIGFGERCGNATLSTIIADLTLKCGYDCGVKLESLKRTARRIAEISNFRIRSNLPYVGESAFAHKGGMHIDAVQKIPQSFEHIDPSLVGNERRFLVSEVSGRGTVLPRLQKFVPDADKNSKETEKITQIMKERELFGYQYEAAEASFELLMMKELNLWTPPFKIKGYEVRDRYPSIDGEQSIATVEIEVDGSCEYSTDVGNGPVNAVDKAIRKILCKHYPEIEKMFMSDIKVRFIEMGVTTDAKIRVLIESTDESSVFTTIGVSTDIVGASCTALIESFEYEFAKKEKINDKD